MTTIEEFAADAQEDYKAVGCVSYLTVGKYLETILEHFDSLQDYLPPEVMNSAIEQLQNTDRTYNDRVTQWAIERKKEFERYLEEEKHTVERLQGGEKKTPTVLDKGKTRSVKEFKPIEAITAADLDKLELKPIEWLVKDILPTGLSILGAPSKYFKSYMALDLCISICQGSSFLGFDCVKRSCLYFDLESTKRRPKSRLDQILGKDGKKPDNLYIITGEDDPGKIGAGFEQQVAFQMQEHPDIKLIVVDVFKLIRQPAKRNQSVYDRDYDDFQVLKKIVAAYDIGIMLIHHTRKMKDPSDVFNELSGSSGMLGAQDCAWMISKKDRFDNEATLYITGRDLESRNLKIEFKKDVFRWVYIGTAEDIERQRFRAEYDQSPIVETIKKLVEQGNGHWEGSASDVINASQYLSWKIYDTPKKVGNQIRRYDPLFFLDGIRLDDGRKGNKRFFTFTVITDTNVTTVMTDTNVTDQMTIDEVSDCVTV